MFYYVYVLQSMKNQELYIGYTIDLRKRLQEHNRGLNFSTKPYRPWQIIHFEAYLNEKNARRRVVNIYLKERSFLKKLSSFWEHFEGFCNHLYQYLSDVGENPNFRSSRINSFVWSSSTDGLKSQRSFSSSSLSKR